MPLIAFAKLRSGELHGLYFAYTLADGANLFGVCISYARAVNTRAAKEEEEIWVG